MTAVLKTAKVLREEFQDLVKEARSIQDNADENHGGVLTEAEQARFDELTAPETGLIDQAEASLERRNEMDARKSALIAKEQKAIMPTMRGGLVAPDPLTVGKPSGLPNLRAHRCVAFANSEEGRKEAFLAGNWLQCVYAKMRNMDVPERAMHRVAGTVFDPRAQQTIGTPGDGGYLVPTPLDQAVINYRELSGITRGLTQYKTMTADTLKVDKKATYTTVEYATEATAINESKQTWTQFTLNAEKRAILVRVSQELNDDAIINVMDDLAMEMGSDLSIKMDEEFITADGGAGFANASGLIPTATQNVTMAATNTSWSDVVLQDILDLMALVPDKFHVRSPAFICSTSFYWTAMAKILAEAGGNYIATLESGPQGAGSGVGPSASFLGYPVWFTQWMPADSAGNVCLLFGSFPSATCLGERIGVRIAQSEHRYFDQDALAIRATSRYDIKTHEPTAYATLTLAAA